MAQFAVVVAQIFRVTVEKLYFLTAELATRYIMSTPVIMPWKQLTPWICCIWKSLETESQEQSSFKLLGFFLNKVFICVALVCTWVDKQELFTWRKYCKNCECPSCISKLKIPWPNWQAHLLSCSRQLKTSIKLWGLSEAPYTFWHFFRFSQHSKNISCDQFSDYAQFYFVKLARNEEVK